MRKSGKMMAVMDDSVSLVKGDKVNIPGGLTKMMKKPMAPKGH